MLTLEFHCLQLGRWPLAVRFTKQTFWWVKKERFMLFATCNLVFWVKLRTPEARFVGPGSRFAGLFTVRLQIGPQVLNAREATKCLQHWSCAFYVCLWTSLCIQASDYSWWVVDQSVFGAYDQILSEVTNRYCWCSRERTGYHKP